MLQLNSTGREACYVIRLLHFVHSLYFVIIICFVHLTVKLSEGFFFTQSVKGTGVLLLFTFGGRGDIFFLTWLSVNYLKIFYIDVVSKICMDILSTFSSVSFHCNCSQCPLVDRRVTAKAAICKTFTGV
jgi:hypothetical protein